MIALRPSSVRPTASSRRPWNSRPRRGPAASSTSRSFPKNTVVIHENDPADSLFVIESGKVKVYCSDKNGKEYIMNTLGPGDYFGELALLDQAPRAAQARAHADEVALALGKALEDAREFAESMRDFRRANPDVDPSAVAVQLFTSGTTGKPKAAILRHLGDLTTLSPDQLRAQRYQKYRNVGVFTE